jgi:hypothetical protein
VIRRRRDATDSQARELLRRLRDLCLCPAGIELSPGETVRVAGCLTADLPVERGVRYGLELADGRREVLVLRPRAGALQLSRSSLESPGPLPESELLEVELFLDAHGRVTAPSLNARLDLAVCDVRAIEHFLRRLVRVALSTPPPAAA